MTEVPIVTNGVRDLRELVSARIKKAAAAAARVYSVDQALDALGAVEAALEEAAKNISSAGESAPAAKAAIRVEIVTAMLEPDAAAKRRTRRR